MAYLIRSLPQSERRSIHAVLDTHDILHERGNQFDAAGYLHWLDVDRREEVGVWNEFDTVLAIQPNEAELIRSLAPNPTVMHVGHAPNCDGASASTENPHPECIRLGYIGSANYSNWHAINRFLIEVWPDLVVHKSFDAELVVAGKICDWFQMQGEQRVSSLFENGIRLIGQVERLDDFYNQIDIAINPVQFGTGLKIKNVEAIFYGKPLVTTERGASGMSEASQAVCCVVANYRKMAAELIDLCQNSDRRRQMSSHAAMLAKKEFSDESTYSELAKHFLKVVQPA
jgi:glycosyltransferase involved in cell wall biosynthesis